MTPKFSIVIPTYSNSSGVFECLDSIVKQTDLGNVEIIVVANGAPEATSRVTEVYRKYPVSLIWIPDACGYTHACNIGIEAARGDYIVLLNDDVIILGAHWLDLLYGPFESDSAMAITGPLMLTAPECGREFLVFFCVMISRTAINAIGVLDEVFNPGYAEDCDYAIRAVNAGWKIQQVPPSPASLIDKGCEDLPEWKRAKMWHNPFPCFHDGNKTFGSDPKFEGLIKRNSAILVERYGSNVNQVGPTTCKCGKPLVDGVCVGAEGVPSCEGLHLWRAAQIDGWFGVDEMQQLATWVKLLPPSSKVVSIGAWHGRSSRCIADNLPEGGQLWDCDTWAGSSGEPEMHSTAKLREGDHAHQWYWCNLQEHIEAGRVVPVRMDSGNAAHTLGHLIEKGQMEKFALCFVDADHSGDGVRRDIESWLPLIREDGIMCGHDYYPEDKEPFAWIGVRTEVQKKFPNVQKFATSLWYAKPHEQQRGRVFDCFLFHNELDVLEIRLATLYDYVDHFVLVEAGETHSGEPKPLYFDENKERFAQWLPKIRHVTIDKFPEFEGSIYDKAWARERHQRDACMIALEDARPDDIVVIGDADEIASPEAVANYKVSDGLVRLKQRMFYYYLNCENKEGWDWQKIAPYSLVKERTPCGIRYPPAADVPLVENGGWHFSFLGDAEHVRQKIRDYSHQEYNTPEILADVEAATREGRDLFGRDLKYEFISQVDNVENGALPSYVHRNWTHLVESGLWHLPDPAEAKRIDLSARHWTVTACVSTKDRYTTTLPLCLSAIFNQTRLPDRFTLYDDSDNRIPAEQLCQQQPFEGLFKLATDKGVAWEIQLTPRLGQVANHQHCLDTTDSQFIWRVDDDEIPEPDCLENLLNTIRDYERGGAFEKIGAVGGLIHHPGNVPPLPESLTGSLADIDRGNIAWFDWNSGPREVEHLYSSFIYNVVHAREVGGYPRDLSPVGHREESWFTNKLHRAGYKLIVTPHAKTHHLRASTGGIRSYDDTALWEHDEQMFRGYLKACDVVLPESKLIVCDFGLGDHLVLKGIWPELARKFPDRKWALSLCYPEVFKDVPDVTIISIADAKLLVGDRYPDYSLYKWCWDCGWTGSIVDAMKEFYSR